MNTQKIRLAMLFIAKRMYIENDFNKRSKLMDKYTYLNDLLLAKTIKAQGIIKRVKGKEK